MSTLQSELNASVHMIDAVIRDVFDLLKVAEPEKLDWHDALTCREFLNEANGNLRMVRERLDNLLAEQMDGYQKDNVKRHRKIMRRDWQHDDLFRLVMDSRIVDGETGEVESQVDALKAVYGCKGYNASLKELERRGIDPDEYCTTEQRGYTLEVR